jgi:hypothetical protein
MRRPPHSEPVVVVAGLGLQLRLVAAGREARQREAILWSAGWLLLAVAVAVGIALAGQPARMLTALVLVRPGQRRAANKSPDLHSFSSTVWATGLGHETSPRACPDNAKCLFAGTSIDGSDGTRTRDLRPDKSAPGNR